MNCGTARGGVPSITQYSPATGAWSFPRSPVRQCAVGHQICTAMVVVRVRTQTTSPLRSIDDLCRLSSGFCYTIDAIRPCCERVFDVKQLLRVEYIWQRHRAATPPSVTFIATLQSRLPTIAGAPRVGTPTCIRYPGHFVAPAFSHVLDCQLKVTGGVDPIVRIQGADTAKVAALSNRVVKDVRRPLDHKLPAWGRRSSNFKSPNESYLLLPIDVYQALVKNESEILI